MYLPPKSVFYSIPFKNTIVVTIFGQVAAAPPRPIVGIEPPLGRLLKNCTILKVISAVQINLYNPNAPNRSTVEFTKRLKTIGKYKRVFSCVYTDARQVYLKP